MDERKPSDHHEEASHLGRRDFLRAGGLAGLGAAALGLGLTGCSREAGMGPAPDSLFKTAPLERVRIGFVGVGGMGSAHVRNFMRIDRVDIIAVCDIVEEKVARVQQWIVDSGKPKPAGYSRGEYDFVRMCEAEELDLVFTATPWRWHVPVCVAAMENGKHAATEVPAAVTMEECWQLVETAEKRKKHCVMMENCCYDRIEMLVLNLVRKGMLGEIIHGMGAYNHDLRALKFAEQGEALWRTAHSIKRNGNLYPTHGLGPVAQCMNINRGDRFDYLVSMSGVSRGLNLWAAEHFGADDPRSTQTYALGDINTSLIRTVNGKTITVVHDTDSPRPYTRINLVQGTKGIARKWPDKIHIEGRSPGHGWEEAEAYLSEFEHPLWKALKEASIGAGHGGMDFIEDYRLVHCLRNGLPMDMDVYDAAAWSVVSELSERSVARRSRPMDFPDFTRGKWRNYPPLDIVSI